MAYDDLFPYIGDFGRYQKRIYFLLCLTAIPCTFHKFAGSFLMPGLKHRCKLPHELGNASYLDLPQDAFHEYYPNLEKKFSQCEMYDKEPNTSKIVKCKEFLYDYSNYKSSAVVDWEMVCSRELMKTAADAIFMAGVLVGSIVFGHLSDRIGRKLVFFASLVIQVVFGVLAGVTPEYISFQIFRFVIGATTSGVFLVSYVLAIEMVGPSRRLFTGIAVMMFTSAGIILTVGIAYFSPDWKFFQIAITLPGLLFMCYYWFIPESARWLLSKHRKDEAIKIVEAVAKENKVIVPKEVLDSISDDQVQSEKNSPEKQPSILDLFRYPNLRRKSLLIFADWFVTSATYYGLSWNIDSLGGDKWVWEKHILSGFVEFPAYTFLLFTLDRWGRRNILSGCMLLTGLALLLTNITDNQIAVTTLVMVSKMAITGSYGTIYVFTTEQFPTPVRGVGLGVSSMMARVGAILASFVMKLSDFWKPMPLVIFGALAMICGLSSLCLPETLNKQLPETIEEGERFGKKIRKDEEIAPHNPDHFETIELNSRYDINGTNSRSTKLNGHTAVDS